jgi:ketosteroid isomerase-like protein
MSRENVEAVAASWDLFLRRDFDTWVETIDPDIEWDISAYPLPDWPDRGKGRQEWLQHVSDYLAGWVDHSQEVRELIDAGDNVVVVVHETARMRDSGATLDRDLNFVFTLREGKAVRWRVFQTKEEALEAVGLRE